MHTICRYRILHVSLTVSLLKSAKITITQSISASTSLRLASHHQFLFISLFIHLTLLLTDLLTELHSGGNHEISVWTSSSREKPETFLWFAISVMSRWMSRCYWLTSLAKESCLLKCSCLVHCGRPRISQSNLWCHNRKDSFEKHVHRRSHAFPHFKNMKSS